MTVFSTALLFRNVTTPLYLEWLWLGRRGSWEKNQVLYCHIVLKVKLKFKLTVSQSYLKIFFQHSFWI